jgi:hypothetical protein
MNNHCLSEFKPLKEELMEKRVMAYKKNDWDLYASFIMQAQKAYVELLEKRTKDVLSFLEISPENW